MANNKGFALIEMLVVIIIIGLIALISYPNLHSARSLSNENDRARHEYVINKALKQYYALAGKYPKYSLPVNLISFKEELYRQTGVSLNVEKYPDTNPNIIIGPDGDGKYEISSLHVK